jgi:hypothetical protein
MPSAPSQYPDLPDTQSRAGPHTCILYPHKNSCCFGGPKVCSESRSVSRPLISAMLHFSSRASRIRDYSTRGRNVSSNGQAYSRSHRLQSLSAVASTVDVSGLVDVGRSVVFLSRIPVVCFYSSFRFAMHSTTSPPINDDHIVTTTLQTFGCVGSLKHGPRRLQPHIKVLS